jgi:hypothetical protein
MLVSTKILQVGAITFLCTFSTLAWAQHILVESGANRQQAVSLKAPVLRELPIYFPQGKLYCADGSLAYQKLYPHGWQKLTDEDAVKIAVQSVEESCEEASPDLCKEYRVRLSKLRAAIRNCF